MITLGTNISALKAQRQLSLISDRLSRVYERLSSGKRINRPSDDPAGFAIAESLRAQQKIATVAIRNAHDGLSAVSIADSALGSVSSILTRLAELASQAANGTYSRQQRSALQNEFSALGSELSRIVTTTTFNGINLINGQGSLSIQLGLNGDPISQLRLEGIDGTLGALGLGDSGLIFSLTGATVAEGQSSARLALDAMQEAIGRVGSMRGQLGAYEARLGFAINNLTVQRENFAAAESRIMDADIAQEVAELTKLTILQQVAVAVLSQASQQPALALILLR